MIDIFTLYSIVKQYLSLNLKVYVLIHNEVVTLHFYVCDLIAVFISIHLYLEQNSLNLSNGI